MELWAIQNDVELCFIRPGKPAENGFIESFNDRLRDECRDIRPCRAKYSIETKD